MFGETLLCIRSGTCPNCLMRGCPTCGSECSSLCLGLSEDFMSNDTFRVCAKDVSDSGNKVSLIFHMSVDLHLLLCTS